VRFWDDLSIGNSLKFTNMVQPGDKPKRVILRFISLKNLSPVFALWDINICLATISEL